MRSFLRNIFINFLTLLLIAKLTGAIDFSENYLVLIWAAFFLTLLNLLVKPILNLLLMPINLLTLGAFRWVINAIVLLLVTLIVKAFVIKGFVFPGFTFSGFIVPQVSFSFLWALFLVSFLVEIARFVIFWLLGKQNE
ncbi:hypothetical protein COS54_02885 [Candidatus Shapirobacteria bacterium CG03_land_8_20_14_0_80_39_12]|uniref:Phage holin family protein n=1 Tax=Candidatus Shapirobacteria bacterium CG03_land_8_20_14_0_80_39_12 TaxID=1974879 RepID=A0A2M7BBM2_9BACT|nr:MAG: hypothetical protein COS54_02885 [Candidatus Shapirobacteria bacterium CG03_land_8_20_14_0_80_39_12]